MKTYAITIQPLSPFGTPLKGDTLFGQFCWQAANDDALLTKPLDDVIAEYPRKPFAVFSSAYPALPDGSIALKRPDAPLELLFDFSGKGREEIIENRKIFKKRKWLIYSKTDALTDFKSCDWLDDAGLAVRVGLEHEAVASRAEFSHNSINRLTGTTGANGFAPFSQESTVYAPGCRLMIFAGVDKDILPLDSLNKGLERIGAFGFGRDASTGQGKFIVESCEEVNLPAYGSAKPNALYTLAPSVPCPDDYHAALFTPFTRFGRHGDRLAISGKPFKKPVIMVDEAALLFPRDMTAALEKPFAGTAVTGISKAQKSAVSQGYSLYIPVYLEVG